VHDVGQGVNGKEKVFLGGGSEFKEEFSAEMVLLGGGGVNRGSVLQILHLNWQTVKSN